ncbi:MAG: sugar nucleotide-binding protein [Verrucomicrobia bacterium]|nr:sugar nucleotide-binding protein [Verrucomicrobiota bacterium]
MIYLLGGSGYVGQAYQLLLTQQGIPFRNLKRSEVNYADPAVLTAALRADQPAFLINAAGYTGKPNVDACELHKAECLDGNAVLPGRIAEACAAAGVPWGHVSFWRLRIPFDHRESPRNYLTKLMRYQRLLEATNSISQLQEFVAATFACWEKRVPFGTYNVTNPGQVTTRQVVDHILKSGVLKKDYIFFKDESEFMHVAAKTPRSNCTMNSAKLASVGIQMTEVNEALERDLKRWQKAS